MKLFFAISLAIFFGLEYYAIDGVVQPFHSNKWKALSAKLSGASVENAPGTSNQYRLDVGYTYRCNERVYHSDRFELREMYGNYGEMQRLADSLKKLPSLTAFVDARDCSAAVLTLAINPIYMILSVIVPLVAFVPFLFVSYYGGKSITSIYSKRLMRLKRLFNP